MESVSPNKELAKSILDMTLLIEKRIALQDRKTMHALILADYYEILKELLTALLLLDGHKTVSHKELLDYFAERRAFPSHESILLDDLRVMRNRILYEGFSTRESYLRRHETEYRGIISKLRALLKQRLAEQAKHAQG